MRGNVLGGVSLNMLPFALSDVAVYDDRATREQPRHLIHCQTVWSNSIEGSSSSSSSSSSSGACRHDVQCPEPPAPLGLHHTWLEDTERDIRAVTTSLRVCSHLFFLVVPCSMFALTTFWHVYTVCKISHVGFSRTSPTLVVLSFSRWVLQI